MGVKKIKISALPLADTLVGLYTIGVNFSDILSWL